MLEIFGFLVIGLLLMTVISLYQHYRDRKGASKTRKKNLKVKPTPSNELWLLEQGYVENDQILNMVSYDEGRTWNVVEHGVVNPKKITTLEERHIQVLLYPEAWVKLKAYVKKNGPISLRDRHGVHLLRQAGFEVRIRDNFC